MSTLVQAFLAFIFPPHCYFCKIATQERKWLCSQCMSLMSLIAKEERCFRCFRESDKSICERCQQKAIAFTRIAACFSQEGPASSIAHCYLKNNHPAIAKDLAAWMVYQFCLLEWPLPHFVLAFPLPLAHVFPITYNQNRQLAVEIANMLSVKFINVLRESLWNINEKKGVLWKKNKRYDFSESILFLVGVNTSREKIDATAELLQETFPKSIYVLNFLDA